MKKYIYASLFFFIGYQSQAQIYNYTDLSILFSQNNNTGTARFSGLNGAMGAVGGDLSSINVNPAGIAVYNNGEITATLSNHNFSNTTNYYNSTVLNKSSVFNTDQIGTVFVSRNGNRNNNDWSKTSFAINYQKTNNFHTRNSFFGNSGFASFIKHPNHPEYNENPNLDNSPNFDNAISQDFYNYIDGKASKVNLALAGQYGKNFYAGFSLNLHQIDFTQTTTLNELSKDSDGKTLDVLVSETLYENADGFSLNFGFIYKPIQSVRIGLSYQSPTWYNFTEDYNSEELIANIPEANINAADPAINNSFLDYKLTTPNKTTGSIAFVLGKIGFINIDHTIKSYNSLALDGLSDFNNDNQYFTNTLKSTTHNFNIGGEFRVQKLSLRAGFGYEESPFKDNINPQNIDVLKLGDKYTGSLGAGFRFGASKLDIAYRRVTQDNEYDFNDINQQFTFIDSALTANKNSRITATYSYSF